MSRPENYDDLAPHERVGDQIFTWNYNLSAYPEIEQYVVKAKLAARSMGMLVDNSSITLALTGPQLEDKLLAKQQTWDRGETLYSSLSWDPTRRWEEFSTLLWDGKNAIRAYCRAEGVPEPKEPTPETEAELAALREKLSVAPLDWGLTPPTVKKLQSALTDQRGYGVAPEEEPEVL